MIVYEPDLEAEDIRALALEGELAAGGLRRVPGDGHAFALRPVGERFRGPQVGPVYVVCQHGHEDFIRRLLDAFPEAQIATILYRYQGREDFERVQPLVREKYAAKYPHSECSCAVP